MSLEMRQQRRAFTSLPQTWKKTPESSPDFCLSYSAFIIKSSPSAHPPSSLNPCCCAPNLPPSLTPLSFCGLLRFLFILLASLCLLPCPTQAAWFRVGVVGPWGCDPLFAKALPSVAAQLAVNRINKDASLSYAVTFEYAVLQVHNWPKLHTWFTTSIIFADIHEPSTLRLWATQQGKLC